MEFNKKLQELRKQREFTQEELAEKLFVSRTAISKWESGRGYPSIDSLKAIAEFFSVSIDELLSNKELITVAEKDSQKKAGKVRDLVFGLLDCSVASLFFLPLFGQPTKDAVQIVPLLALANTGWYINGVYMAILLLTIAWGILLLALLNHCAAVWAKTKSAVSIFLSAFGVLIFIASRQPYAATFFFMILIIKGVLLVKRA